MTRHNGMIMKKYTADTYNEAYIKARAELGPDAMIITSQKVMASDWGGLYSREVIELTAVAPPPAEGGPSSTMPGLPPHVVPSSNLPRSSPAQAGSRMAPAGAYGPNARPLATAPAMAAPTMPLPTGTPSRVTIKTGPTARAAGHIRDIDEGEDDPETAARDKVLQNLLQQHIERKRTPSSTAPTPPTPVGPAHPGLDEMQQMRLNMERLMEMVQDLQSRATETITRPVSAPLPAGLAAVRAALETIEMPATVVDDLVHDVEGRMNGRQLNSVDAVRKALVIALQERLQFAPPIPPRSEKGPTIAAIIGPTGVGKTTTLAKLAAWFALSTGAERRKLALFTFDTYRIGATQQLFQFATILEVPLEIIQTPADLTTALQTHADKDLILVDTAGQSQRNKKELEELKELLTLIPTAVRYLALAATTKYTDMCDRERRFGAVGYDHVIFTKVDETDSVGPLLALLLETGARLAYLTNGQNVPDDIQIANPSFFINTLFRS